MSIQDTFEQLGMQGTLDTLRAQIDALPEHATPDVDDYDPATFDLDARVRQLAQEQHAVTAYSDELSVIEVQLRSMLHEVTQRLKAASDGYDAMRERLRSDVLAHIAATGEVPADRYNAVTFARRSKWAYDKDAALQWVEANAPEFVRVKTSLMVREFEAALKDGLSYADAEPVNEPRVSIDTKLAHVLAMDMHEEGGE